MVIKPFSHLARQGFAKTLVHGYAQSAVAASQSSYAANTGSLGQFHNYPIQKFARTTQLQTSFQNASGSSGTGAGAGAKTGHASHAPSSSGDGGLATYYAAWQHAQLTGDESDWRQHQFSKKIGWKSTTNTEDIRRRHKHWPNLLLDAPRSARLSVDRAFSDPETNACKASPEAEAEALGRVNEAIAQEVQSVQASDGPSAAAAGSSLEAVRQDKDLSLPVSRSTDLEKNEERSLSSSTKDAVSSQATQLTSPAVKSDVHSNQIIELAQSARYPEIPSIFEHMLKEGITPTPEAYNAILLSAIHLTRNVYQALPKALEVYGDMVRRQVTPNRETHAILIDFLTRQAQDVHAAKEALRKKQLRFGAFGGGHLFRSSDLEQQLLAEDSSLRFALQQYRQSCSRSPKIELPPQILEALIQTCAQHSEVDTMLEVLADVKSRQWKLPGKLFAPIISAFARVKDLKGASNYYEEYRAYAIANIGDQSGVGDVQDIQVYSALMQAFLATDNAAGASRFHDRILQTYEKEESSQDLRLAMEKEFSAVNIKHALDSSEFEVAMSFAQRQALDPATRSRLIGMISETAADLGYLEVARKTIKHMSPGSSHYLNAQAALLAANLRLGDLPEARSLWATILDSPSLIPSPVELATMYAKTSLGSTMAEEVLQQARTMFQRARDVTPDQQSRAASMEVIDEAVILFSGGLMGNTTNSAMQANMHLIRMMLENGGLVSPAAEHAIASIGPEVVDHLKPQDIALALHVQAGMIAQSSGLSEPAHLPRFAYLLEIILDRGIPLDPSTVHAVTESSSRLKQLRPDLAQRWKDILQPVPLPEPITSSPLLSASPTSTLSAHSQHQDADPYAHNADLRASSAIADQLEDPSGRIENHLSHALSRLRDVRRAGRHPRYTTYAKLITAAGKAGRVHLIHEIFGMANHDVPLVLSSATVRAGWVAIFDAMVAACLTVGDRHLASKYHGDLRNIGAAPSANTFGLYITTLKESTKTLDEATEAVKIFQQAVAEGVEPGVFLYNAVIGKLGKARRIDDCLFYFGDMQSRKVKPTSVTYGTLVNALCRTSEERFAEEMFEEMETMSNYRPRAAPYNSIIQYFLHTKRDRQKVLAYVERMKAQQIKPTSHTFKLLIEAHASLEPVDLEAGAKVLRDMQAAGVKPEAVHYGSLIHARGCVLHDMAGARDLFDSVLSGGTIRPTDNLYQNLFEAMVANHQVAQTRDVLLDMARRNVEMTPYIANTLIHGWAADGNIAEAKSVYTSLGYAKREPSTYEAMTRAFLSVEDHEGASEIVQEMLSKRYPAAVADKVLALIGGTSAKL